MNFIAPRMLVADRAKYFSLIFAIAFASFLAASCSRRRVSSVLEGSQSPRPDEIAVAVS